MTSPRLIAVALLALTAICWEEAAAQSSKPFIVHGPSSGATVAPEITSHGPTAAVSVDENTTAVASLTFTPSGAELSLSGTDSALFEINATGSGTATLGFIDEPDYETPADANTDNDYLVTVTATNDALTDATAFTVTVDDLNEDLAANSLRPNEVFGTIPGEAIAAGFFPNDLSTSVRTDVTPTTRGGVIDITGGSYSSPYTTTTANRTYRLTGNVTYEGCGIRVAHSNVTIDLNGYALTYNDVAPSDVETGTVTTSGGGGGTTDHTITVNASAATYTTTSSFSYLNYAPGDTVVFAGFTNGGNNGTKTISTISSTVITVTSTSGLVNETGNGNEKASNFPTLTPSGITLTTNARTYSIVEFTSGAESGNVYDVLSNTTSALTLSNQNEVFDSTAEQQTWQDGGPAPGDAFRIYDPRRTFGVGTVPGTYPGGVIEVVNGEIAQGDGYGRGVSYQYCAGLCPVFYRDGGASWVIGGVEAAWHSDNTGGFFVSGSTNAVVSYCELNDSGEMVSDRQRGTIAISAGSGAHIHHNLIRNHRQVGISAGGDRIVEYNEIYGDSRATNSTGTGTFSDNDVIIRYNNFYKVGQHPVCIGIAEESNRVEVYGNWCEAMTTVDSPEYGYNLACALSNRWGTRTDANHYYENALITYAHDDDYKARSVFTGGYDVLVEELYEDNFIGSFSDDDTECHAVSCGNENLIGRNNTLVSTHNIYWLGDSYWIPFGFARWIGNTTIKSGSDPNFATFFASDYDNNTANAQEVEFISGIYGTGTAADDIDFVDGPDNSQPTLRFGYNLTVTVTDGGSPVEGATVTIRDKDSNILRDDYLTDASGEVVVDVPTYYRQGPSLGSTTLMPLTVEAEFGAATGSDTISPTSDDSISVGIAE